MFECRIEIFRLQAPAQQMEERIDDFVAMLGINKEPDILKPKAPFGFIPGVAHFIDRDLIENAPFHQIAEAGEIEVKVVGQGVVKAQIIIDHPLGGDKAKREGHDTPVQAPQKITGLGRHIV